MSVTTTTPPAKKPTGPKAKPTAKPANGAAKAKSVTDKRKIEVVATKNPHEPGSKRHKRFAALKSGMLVAESGLPNRHLAHLVAKGHIKIVN